MTEDAKVLDLTANGVEFAPWPTVVENDQLALVAIALSEDRILTAVFSSKEKQANVEFTFDQVDAFRVLDENGLLELWAVSRERTRPAQTTFRVRGHMWQKESPLAWIHGAEEPYYSYMVATGWDCLEVISINPPHINVGPLTS